METILRIPRKNIHILVLTVIVGLSACAVYLLVRVFAIMKHPEAVLIRHAAVGETARKPETLPAMKPLPELPAFSENTFKEKEFFKTQDYTEVKEADGLLLLGVSIGARTLALIRNTTTNETYYCSTGDSINGFTVKEITKNKVVLQSPRGITEIER